MKIKQYLTITSAKDFLQGNYVDCFSLFDHETRVKGWINCGEITLDVDVDTGEVLRVATAELDEKLTAARVLVDVLEGQKRDLLALGYDGK